MNKYFFIILFMSCSTSFAQLQIFYPDSIISFGLKSVDTVLKSPLVKEQFIYTTNYKLKERISSRWNEPQKRWIPDKHTIVYYYPKEILIEYFDIEHEKQEIQYQRTIVTLDSLLRIKEVNVFRKDRFNPRFELNRKIGYSYKKNNLERKQVFQNVNLMYLKEDFQYQVKSDSLRTLQSSYNPIDVKPENVAESIETKTNRRLTLRVFKKPNAKEYYLKDTMIYTNKLLSYIEHRVIAKIDHDESIFSKSNTIVYTYDTTYHIASKFNYEINEQGRIASSPLNSFFKFFCSASSPIKEKSNNDIRIEDIIDF